MDFGFRRNSTGTPLEEEDFERSDPFVSYNTHARRNSDGDEPKIIGSVIDTEKKGVYVCVRVRPPLKSEIKKGGRRRCVKIGKDLKSITVKLKRKDMYHDFHYDHVFDEHCTQKDVYDMSIRPVLSDLVNGFNCSIMAYGQTSSGKTYTMFGPGFEYKKKIDLKGNQEHRRLQNSQEKWGMIPRLISDLFSECGSLDQSVIETKISASFIEIYKEDVRDLLEPSKTNLKIHYDPKGLSVPTATVVPVLCCREVMSVMKRGLRNRFVAETKCNTESSRSHAIMIITISIHNYIENLTKNSQLYLVDLAGSEKVCKTKAEGERLIEACKINLSLLSLRQVITKLTSVNQNQHIPYRDSKLTFLLQNSFGGNSISILLMNVSPHSWNRTETISTLRFGERSLRIKNKPRQNKQRTIKQLETLLSKAEAEIRNLKMMNQKLKNLAGSCGDNGNSGNRNGHIFGLGKTIDLSSFHSYFICPLTRNFMKQPVIALDGITYEKTAILKHLSNPRKRMISPITGERIVSKLIIPNITVNSQIQYFQDTYPEAFREVDYSDFSFIGYENFYIPNDVLLVIFSFIDPISLIRCGNTNCQWNTVSKNELLWKNLYYDQFGKDERLVLDWKEYFWNRYRGRFKKAPWSSTVLGKDLFLVNSRNKKR